MVRLGTPTGASTLSNVDKVLWPLEFTPISLYCCTVGRNLTSHDSS